jgi:urease accessory protein UreF
MIVNQTDCLPAAEILLGDFHALGERIGSPEGLVTLSEMVSSVRLDGLKNPARLRSCLRCYLTEILLPIELPAIRRAYEFARMNQARELIALDRQLSSEPKLQHFSASSRAVGRDHLLRLAPLRDHRVVQRYVRAFEAGEAMAWHTLVYGVVLAVYSLPLRQGLLHYAEQTLNGFVLAAARTHRLPKAVCREMIGEINSGLPAAVEKELGHNGTLRLTLC